MKRYCFRGASQENCTSFAWKHFLKVWKPSSTALPWQYQGSTLLLCPLFPRSRAENPETNFERMQSTSSPASHFPLFLHGNQFTTQPPSSEATNKRPSVQPSSGERHSGNPLYPIKLHKLPKWPLSTILAPLQSQVP